MCWFRFFFGCCSLPISFPFPLLQGARSVRACAAAIMRKESGRGITSRQPHVRWSRLPIWFWKGAWHDRAYADNIRNFLRLYNEISLALKEDTELVNLFQSQLTDTCYPDPELKTLTIDVGFYISRFYSQQDENDEAATEWYGTDYNPGLTIENWKKLLKDGAIFTTSALEIMKRIKDYGGQASCTQLEVKYGETKNFYNSGSVALAHRVCEAAGIKPATREDGSAQWWTVFTLGVMQTKARMAALFGN